MQILFILTFKNKLSYSAQKDLYMSTNIWFTCCTHFFHDNILTFTDKNGALIRPGFSNVEEMNQCIIDTWNETVDKDSVVYLLGDVVFGSQEQKEYFAKKIFPKLKGKKKILILGNHDDGKWHAKNVQWSKIRSEQSLDDLGLFLTHRPAHIDSMYSYRLEKNLINVHGHIHQLDPPSGGRYVNVCVERNNYKPFHIDEVKALAGA